MKEMGPGIKPRVQRCNTKGVDVPGHHALQSGRLSMYLCVGLRQLYTMSHRS